MTQNKIRAVVVLSCAAALVLATLVSCSTKPTPYRPCCHPVKKAPAVLA